MQPPATLKSAALGYWKNFLPTWLFTLALCASVLAGKEHEAGSGAEVGLARVLMPGLMLSMLWWMRLHWTGKMRLVHALVLGIGVPLVAVCVSSLLQVCLVSDPQRRSKQAEFSHYAQCILQARADSELERKAPIAAAWRIPDFAMQTLAQAFTIQYDTVSHAVAAPQ